MHYYWYCHTIVSSIDLQIYHWCKRCLEQFITMFDDDTTQMIYVYKLCLIYIIIIYHPYSIINQGYRLYIYYLYHYHCMHHSKHVINMTNMVVYDILIYSSTAICNRWVHSYNMVLHHWFRNDLDRNHHHILIIIYIIICSLSHIKQSINTSNDASYI